MNTFFGNQWDQDCYFFHLVNKLKASVQERPQWNLWSFYYFAPIFPICCMWTKIDKNYIVLYFFLPISAFSSRNNLCKNLVGVLCFLLFKAKYKRNGLSPLFNKINGAGHLSLIWIQSDLLRYHPPSSTPLTLIGASAFAFNKYPHKPYIFWKLNSSRLLLIPFKKSKY